MSKLDVKKSPRRPRILLGVTGSVAAVKAPEIAVRLVHDFNAQVRVLLSAGGSNFWDKASEYHSEHWVMFQQIIKASEATDSVDTPTTESFQIQLYCTYLSIEKSSTNMLCMPDIILNLKSCQRRMGRMESIGRSCPTH